MKRARPSLPCRAPSLPAATAVFGILLALAASAGESRLIAQRPPAGLRVAVTAAETGRPVAGAVVRVGSAGFLARTGDDGIARFGGLPSGAHTLSVEALAFLAARSIVTLEPGVVRDVAIVLEADPIPLASVEVDVPRRVLWLEMAGFYERAEGGMGTFLDPEAVRKRADRAARLSDMLRQVPGLRVVESRVAGTYVIESRRGTVSFRQPCRPALWLDGVPLGLAGTVHIDAIAHPREILAMEVYDGPADVPSAFDASSGACGAILFWTGETGRGS